ncbi:MAG: aquaporin family protein [Methanocalculus sp. MSAO_Arc1]|uniref:MIP/aquaporin family protein n=1 Tax=Methanocalculus TaxID=71151 RepID=UPI000FF2C4F7|nr:MULTISPECIES: MIP/aquaporin family protein [unclassified Methanocalculus]MCP1662019.1 glycerol uptake facilitator protein [Methanocalculus sp. AMF5]RQD79615.1 MAG: aquaporin family protein [Methanocalculus sp. MSAO_Arc1]
MSLLKKCVAELIGTFMLVFFGAGAAAITLMLAKGEQPMSDFSIGIGYLGGLGDWLAIGLAFGLVIAASIYALGRISGAHINPAVTIALWATKRFPTREVPPYIIAQLIGATMASVLFFACAGPESVTTGGLGATAPFPGITYSQAILVEAIGTFLLMLVIMGVAVDKRAPEGFAGLTIGLTVAGIITTIGNISGSAINPARTFGPYVGNTLFGGDNLWEFFPIYVIGPIAGALVAVFLYDWLNSE